MRVFLCGATGFIGGHTLRMLLERGHEVTCLTRLASVQRLPRHERLTIVAGDWLEPDAWIGHVDGHEAVVNSVGIIRERGASTFRGVQTDVPVQLFGAAASVGVRKIVQVSALGADAQAVSQFHLSKRAADEAVRASGVPFVVLRPSFVYGPGDHSMTFFRRLATLPLTPVPGDGRFLVQPLHIADLVRAIGDGCERDDLGELVVDVGGSTTLTFNALLDLLCRRAARRDARKVHVPWPLLQLAARVTDALGGRGPITSDELLMLRRGSFTDNSRFVEAFGFTPGPFTP